MNINHSCRFILTPEGERIIREHDAKLNRELNAAAAGLEYDWFKYHQPINENGERREQIWAVMAMFGPHMHIGSPPFFKDNDILFKD